jgi:hypothetical protein
MSMDSHGALTAESAGASEPNELEPGDKPSQSPRAIISRQLLFIAVAIAVLVLLGTRRLLFSSGVPIWGDFSSFSSDFGRQTRSVWNTFQYGGLVNYDLRTWPWLAPVAAIAGSQGTSRFALVNRVFIILSITTPLVVGTFCAAWMTRMRPRRKWLAALCGGIVFAGNPWSVAHTASGHPALVIGFGLLPAVVLITMLGRDWKLQALALGAFVGAEAALSFQAAVLAGIVVIAYLDWTHWKYAVKTMVLTAFAALVGSFYWVLPLLLALRAVPSGGTLGSTRSLSVSTVASLSQLGDPMHVLGARSVWWRPFSDGLYLSAGIGRAETLILTVSFGGLVVLASRYLNLGDAALLIVGIVPQLLAHEWPALYASVVRLPGFGLFLDPSYFAVLYLVVIWRAIPLLLAPAAHIGASTRRESSIAPSFVERRRFITRVNGLERCWRVAGAFVAFLALFATILPWTDGDLHGALRTSPTQSALSRSVQWVNDNLSGTTLWLPVVPYLLVDGQTVNDPVRFWSSTPIANSYAPSYYDTSPTYGENLLDFESFFEAIGSQKSDVKMLRFSIGRVLARAGMSGLIIRRNALASVSATQLAHVVRGAPGLALAASFGPIDIYRVAAVEEGTAWTTTPPALTDAGWYGLTLAGIGGAPHQQPLIPLYQEKIDWLIDSFRREGASIAAVVPGPLELLFGEAPLDVPENLQRRPWYLFDGLPGYEVNPDEVVTIPADGIAAFGLVGGDQVRATCAGIKPPQRSKSSFNFDGASNTGPTSGRRWISLPCVGTAELHFGSGQHQWYLGSVSLTTSEFEHRVSEVASTMSSPGSAYVYTSATTTIAKLGHKSAFASLRENPALVDSGDFRLDVKGGSRCNPSRGYLWPSGADPITVRLRGGPGVRSARVPLGKGWYQLLVTGHTSSCDTMTLKPVHQPGPPSHLNRIRFSGLSDKTYVPRASGLLYRGNGGPWSVSTAGTNAPAFRANALETWYPTGDDATIDPGPLRRLPLFLFVAYAVGIAGLLTLTGTRRHRPPLELTNQDEAPP